MQRLRRLLGSPSYRSVEGRFVVEGAKILGEALDGGAAVESVYLDPAAAGGRLEAVVARCLDAGIRVYDLEAGVLSRVADTVTPQPILAVVPTIDITLTALQEMAPDLVVVCAGLRDPGNAGTVLRSSEAAGVDAVVFCEGSVDCYNPKTVRASAGALFHLPLVAAGGATVDVVRELGRWGLTTVGTVAHGGEDYTEIDFRPPTAMVLGSEANGLTGEVTALCDVAVTIPMTGRAESLNVGMAAAVICFEVARQRRLGRPHPPHGRPGAP